MIGISVAPRRRQRLFVAGGQPDFIAPVLTSLSLDPATFAFGFTSDEVGACHWLVDTGTSYADTNALVAAKPTGAASGSALAMVGANSGEIETSDLPAGQWNLHVGVVDAGGNASNVLSTSFTFSAISESLELNGDPLEWNGDQLIFNAA